MCSVGAKDGTLNGISAGISDGISVESLVGKSEDVSVGVWVGATEKPPASAVVGEIEGTIGITKGRVDVVLVGKYLVNWLVLV